MLKFRAKTWLNVKGIRMAVRQGQVGPLERCALLVESEAKKSMSTGGGSDKTSSPPGEPPHVQTGVLRGSITTAMEKFWRFIVGPTRIAWYGSVHEFGGRHHPPRPFMWPALMNTHKRFKRFFKDMPLARTKAGLRLNTRTK